MVRLDAADVYALRDVSGTTNGDRAIDVRSKDAVRTTCSEFEFVRIVG